MLDPSWSSMGASTTSAAPSSTSTSAVTESAVSAPAPTASSLVAASTSTSPSEPVPPPPPPSTSAGSDNSPNHNPHNNMESSMVSESSGSTSSWIEVEQTMSQAAAVQVHNRDQNSILSPDQTPSTVGSGSGSGSGSAVPSPIPSPYPSLSPPDEDTWSHDDLSLGDDEGLASSISSLSSLQATNPDTDHTITDEDLQPHTQQSTTASLGASALGVSSITSSWHENFHDSLHEATNDHDSPPLSTTSSPISSTTSHSLAHSPHPDITSSSFINVSTPLTSTLAASTLAATAMATSMVQPHVTSLPIEIPSPSLYPQSDHADSDDSHPSTSSGAILIATMCGLFLGLMASSWYFSRRARKRGIESETTITTLQRLLSEKDVELKRLTELFQQYLATPIVVRLTER